MTYFRRAFAFGILFIVSIYASLPKEATAEEDIPYELTVEEDLKEIPPLIPVNLVIRVKNVSDTTFPRIGNWENGMWIKVYQGETLVSETEYIKPFYDYNVRPFKPGAVLTLVHQWDFPNQKIPLFPKLGRYTLQLSCYGPDVYDEENKKIIAVEYKLQAKPLEINVRKPTKGEQGAIKFLMDNEPALRMFYGMGRTVESSELLRTFVKKFPGTIYADFAHFQLGRNGVVKVAKGDFVKREAYRAKLSHFEKVSKSCPLLHQHAALRKYFDMTSNARFFRDADWMEVIQALEALEDSAILFGVEKRRKNEALPTAKRMLKAKQVDPKDSP